MTKKEKLAFTNVYLGQFAFMQNSTFAMEN